MVTIEDFEQIIIQGLNILNHNLEEIIKKLIPEPPPEKRFESVEMQRHKAVLKFREDIAIQEESIKFGVHAVFNTMEKDGKGKESQEIFEWMNANQDAFMTAMRVIDQSNERKSLEERIKFPRKYLISMYQTALDLFKQNQLPEASAALVLCLQFNSLLAPVWLTFGMVFQNIEQQEAALYAFQIASTLDEGNPEAYIYMARSWLALGNWNKASQLIDKAKNICEEQMNVSLANYCDEFRQWMISYSGNSAKLGGIV